MGLIHQSLELMCSVPELVKKSPLFQASTDKTELVHSYSFKRARGASSSKNYPLAKETQQPILTNKNESNGVRTELPHYRHNSNSALTLLKLVTGSLGRGNNDQRKKKNQQKLQVKGEKKKTVCAEDEQIDRKSPIQATTMNSSLITDSITWDAASSGPSSSIA
ncbi:unnamed protein product [Protopolystoma xenopodis]|uniref:Uncharacterized protein n=1 Tax=Protopolystoma xenopodis TaxID=117903 RepID=A0A3S5FFT0_9PLAT|nr:unnamed protein product [Protopolystoma xenopodis]